MNIRPSLSSPVDIARDPQGIASLRSRAATDPKSAVKEAARQFEGLFMQELMKSMRSASMSTGMLDNGGTKLGTEMLDTQYASKLSGLPGGIAEAVARQLERQLVGSAQGQEAVDIDTLPDDPSTQLPPTAAGFAPLGFTPTFALPPAGAANAPQRATPNSVTSARAGEPGRAEPAAAKLNLAGKPHQTGFIARMQEGARAAEAQTGIPSGFLLAQAAHESGWGRHEIRAADGTTSHNIFAIKADSSWKGKVATVTTTEYIDGQPRKVQAKFRAYESYAEAFGDYARMMKDSPRYGQAVAKASEGSAEGFARGLQRAGYATDPAYAAKLTSVINTTLRLQRSMSA